MRNALLTVIPLGKTGCPLPELFRGEDKSSLWFLNNPATGKPSPGPDGLISMRPIFPDWSNTPHPIVMV
jgi:hypothetical protein